MFANKGKTAGRSFRIDQRWLSVLNEEAEKQGVSVNSLLNRLLQQYAYLRYMLRYGAITMTRQGFMEILECCPDEKIKEKGKSAGANILKDLLRTMGVPPTYGIILLIVKKLLSEFAGWFECDHHIKSDKEILHFRHDLGPKWSVYLAAITEGTFSSLLDTKVHIETTNNSVTITIKKQQIK